jgi:hypothetical protein
VDEKIKRLEKIIKEMIDCGEWDADYYSEIKMTPYNKELSKMLENMCFIEIKPPLIYFNVT